MDSQFPNTDSSKSKLLLDETPLIVLPSLAASIGLNEAIILQQLHYWLLRSAHIIEASPWVFNTIESWHEQFPFLSSDTIRRTFKKLGKLGIVRMGRFNKNRYDRTKWYTIDYATLKCLIVKGESQPRSVQTAGFDVLMQHNAIPETTQEKQRDSLISEDQCKTMSHGGLPTKQGGINPEAGGIYRVYAERVRAGARVDALRNISKLLKTYRSQELISCIVAYERQDMSTELRYRIQANNFFGRAERFKEYLRPALSREIDEIQSGCQEPFSPGCEDMTEVQVYFQENQDD